jgi:hypothetical protein
MEGDSMTADQILDPRGRAFVVHGTGPAWQLCVLFLVRSSKVLHVFSFRNLDQSAGLYEPLKPLGFFEGCPAPF